MVKHGTTTKVVDEGRRTQRRRKAFALTAAGTVLGVGGVATLAAWTDVEWVFGGDGAGGPGVSTSTFEVQQNTTAAVDAAAWTDEEDNPGGEMVFSAAATAFTPGDTTYAPVALRTSPTSIAGDVDLQAAVTATGITAADPGGLLFDAIDVRVATDDAPFLCDASAFTGAPGGPTLIADGDLGTTGGSATQTLAAAAGSVQYYCFELELPDPLPLAPGTTADDYMGRSIAPAWAFAGESA
ncbi:SipW-dependent-type signal peptide-containing protein [Cellulomonas sp. B6]|jgi:predicted ribosomally synthesized peptide with SipW-like signal peptide|uniref:SipW-dependent-type signal peptide-containing protein n=1 Tax=Cellulomonas sp. B6 TaxID=1295626 RepID=UPI00073D091C|nr:SipW-dependent-type signal peptide-containing protein [Cellulomonas sp. B6]KSW30190.1 acyl-CoA dehydrogenase [Cellulomonas sp. B6]